MPECRIYNAQGTELAAFNTNDFGAIITVGRSSKCSVSLRTVADTSVSRHHLDIERQAFKWTVTNRSRYGMYKDGVKMATADLTEGSVFRFTKLFLCVGATAKPSSYDLTWDAQTENGQNRAVLWPGLNTVGASNDNYVTVRTMDVSRIHAYINVLQNRITFQNVNPDNPSYINGEDIGDEPVTIKPDDVIVMAETPVKLVHGIRFSTHASIASSKATANRKNPSATKGMYYLMLGLCVTFIAILSVMAYILAKIIL